MLRLLPSPSFTSPRPSEKEEVSMAEIECPVVGEKNVYWWVEGDWEKPCDKRDVRRVTAPVWGQW